MDIKQISETVNQLFTKRQSFMTLCQEIADNFYPERAEFTLRREISTSFGSNLMSSYPVITRRDLGDQIGTMLRPTAKSWFKMVPEDPEREDTEAKRWLEYAAGVQYRAMYRRETMFNRAVKEGDHDFAAFGQCVISCETNWKNRALLYRNWHLRDVAWRENEFGEISLVARKWKPGARDLMRLFKTTHQNVQDTARKAPFDEIDCYHIVCEADMYDGDSRGRPFWSIYYDIQNQHIMEAVPIWNKYYVIPRWQTVSGSQYAFSPATITALPDARLIQSMAYTLLEAGEKATNPPLIATQDVVKSDVGIYAGGITWVKEEYDEKMGASLRPLQQDLRGLPFGAEMLQESREIIMQAFYLNKLALPERAPEMTAYEVGQRIQEYIRGALPIFEPMEANYNGEICEITFDNLMRMGAFGSLRNMPESLMGQDVNFSFESPLHDAIEQQKGQKFLEAKALLADAVAVDQSALALIDIKKSLRDALHGIDVPANWIRTEMEVDEMAEQAAQEQEEQAMLDRMEQGAEVANSLSQVQL